MKIMDALMNEPVMCGGFVWSYGFLTVALQRDGISDIYLAAATNRRLDPGAFDTRFLGAEAQGNLWDAMGTGDLATIDCIIGQA